MEEFYKDLNGCEDDTILIILIETYNKTNCNSVSIAIDHYFGQSYVFEDIKKWLRTLRYHAWLGIDHNYFKYQTNMDFFRRKLESSLLNKKNINIICLGKCFEVIGQLNIKECLIYCLDKNSSKINQFMKDVLSLQLSY